LDVSSEALQKSGKLALSFGYNLNDRFILLNKPELPFKKNSFDVAVIESVLDSIKYELALQYFKEINRVIKKLVYISLISSECVPDSPDIAPIKEKDIYKAMCTWCWASR
jgi:ubiquinone/menaquinone biosynthesis C-methylase UbiE